MKYFADLKVLHDRVSRNRNFSRSCVHVVEMWDGLWSGEEIEYLNYREPLRRRFDLGRTAGRSFAASRITFRKASASLRKAR
jgi:hypothetical protein